jgi:hypothetical protein
MEINFLKLNPAEVQLNYLFGAAWAWLSICFSPKIIHLDLSPIRIFLLKQMVIYA